MPTRAATSLMRRVAAAARETDGLDKFFLLDITRHSISYRIIVRFAFRSNLELPVQIEACKAQGESMDVKKSFRAILCKSILRVLLVVLMITIGAAASMAQSTGGRIRGTVTDTTAAWLRAQKILILNQANGTQRDTESGSNGEYIFLEVP